MNKNDFWDPAQIFTRIKLCEFESLDSANEASWLGAHALGFHIFKYQDLKLKTDKFREIFKYLPEHINKVLLTDVELDELTQKILPLLKVDTIQLYPDWTVQEITHLLGFTSKATKILKVMSARSEENRISDDKEFLKYYSSTVHGFLLDSARVGGTGKVSDWKHCRKIVDLANKPVILAGGLDASNVSEAIKTVKPFGVDVETGVSDRIPGGPLVKNMHKCRKFVEAVHKTDSTPL